MEDKDILRAVEDFLEVDDGSVNPKDRLCDDLNITESEQIDLIDYIQYRFDVEPDDERFKSIVTVNDIIDYCKI